jgi:alkylhydroperoxidase family enzyme
LLFLQAAGSEFERAHELVAAVTEAIRAGHHEHASGDIDGVRHHHPGIHGFARRPGVDPERIARHVERAGYQAPECLLVALAAHATIASPLGDVDFDWIASAAARIGDADLLLETAGVVFAFNTINRIADARRVRLEYRFLRELRPFRGWVERRLASLTGLAYDLSYKHHPRHSPAELLDRLGVLFERLGAPDVPDVFHWLSRSPVVLEGVLEMLEVNVTSAGLRFDLLKEAAAIAVASRAMPGSGLSSAVDQWLSQGSLPDSKTLRLWAVSSGAASDSPLISACRRYAWQVANAAYTITDEQIGKISALGLSDAELLDLTLVTALFSALAIIEPISAAVAPIAITAEVAAIHPDDSATLQDTTVGPLAGAGEGQRQPGSSVAHGWRI